MIKKRHGNIFIIIGAVLILCASVMLIYNIVVDNKAGQSSNETLEKIEKIIDFDIDAIQVPDNKDFDDSDNEIEESHDDHSLDTDIDDIGDESDSKKEDEKDKNDEQEEQEEQWKKGKIPDYIINPTMEMPIVTIEGNDYIGVISFPTLGLSLPVNSECNDGNLKLSPCRYCGSVYQKNIVIAGHNYSKHFRYLKNLHYDDRVFFVDADGNVFNYRVIEVETLPPTAIDEMTNGDWDMTIFTCTFGGKTRVAVRLCLI